MRHEDIRRVITEGLDCPQILHGLGVNDNSAVGGSSGSISDGGVSSGAGAYLS